MVPTYGQTLSPDELLVVATIEQRFRYLADAGYEPYAAVILATHPDVPLETSKAVPVLAPAL